MPDQEPEEEWRRRWAADHAAFVASGMREILREAEAAAEEAVADAWAEDIEGEPDLVQRRVVYRQEYAPKETEARYMVRDAAGLPILRLVDAGDRLVIWSPLDGGALLNPKGPGLRTLDGLVVSRPRG